MEIAAPRQIVRDLLRAGILQSCQRDVRGELARVRRQAEPLANALDLGLQRGKIRRGGNARPHCVRLLLAERADTRQRQMEGRPPHPVERVGDLVGNMAFHVADEAQRQVVVFDVDPARAGQAAAQQRKRKRGITGYLEGGKESAALLPPRIDCSRAANHRLAAGASAFTPDGSSALQLPELPFHHRQKALDHLVDARRRWGACRPTAAARRASPLRRGRTGRASARI